MTDTDLEGNRAALRPLVAPVPQTVADVVAQLDAIGTTAARLLPHGKDDGIAAFTALYHQITCDVRDGATDGVLFRCPGNFILELDVAFARRYLAALRAHLGDGSPTPGCWALLFDRRQEDDVSPWRFASAGVNAHVNFDLAFALLDVWESHPATPLGTVQEQHADYQAINTVFHRRMDDLCERFNAPWTLFGRDGSPWDRAGNVLGDLLVVGTRDLAWTFAERTWRHRDEPDYRVEPTALLDRVATGLAGPLI